MKLSEINIYPIKSLKGISLNEAAVQDRGLKFDRRWMLVDESDRFFTQREVPSMAKVKITVDSESLNASVNGNKLEIAAMPYTNIFADVTVWNSVVPAKVYDEETNAWFSDMLGLKCKLVRMPEESRRTVNPNYAVGQDDIVSFADGYPFMLIGEGSLADLNTRLETPLPMNRFRPNLVVSGSEAFAEDKWKKIRIGETVFHIVKPCERCVLTTVDQTLGEKTGKEPLKTLASYRNVDGKVLFGQNLIAENPGGVLRKGDSIEVIEQV